MTKVNLGEISEATNRYKRFFENVTKGGLFPERLTRELSYFIRHVEEIWKLVVEQNQELLQRREEVKQLMIERDEYLKKFETSESDQILAIKNADRLVDENIKLQRKYEDAQIEIRKCYSIINEKNKFIEQLKVLKNSQPVKVVLPKEVVEALEFIQTQDERWGCRSAFGLLDRVNVALRNGRGGRHLDVVVKWVVEDRSRRDILVQALVNGYTIEEQQTFQTNRKLDASEIKSLRWWYEGALARIKDGRDKDEYCKEAIEEVALYLGGASLLRDISPFCKNQLDKENKETK